MAVDNITLNPGVGGVTVRTLGDASSNEWPVSVVAYATAISPGANVLQVVTDSAGLPVAQEGVWNVGITGTVPVSGVFWQVTQPVSIARHGANLGQRGYFRLRGCHWDVLSSDPAG